MSQNDYIGKTLKPWPILVDHYNLSSLQINVEAIEKHLQELVEWKQYIDAHTASFCGHFSEEIIWRADFEETFCPDCSRDFDEGLAKVMRED